MTYDEPIEETESTPVGFIHLCHCGKWGEYGYGVKLLKGREGRWFCRDHRPSGNI